MSIQSVLLIWVLAGVILYVLGWIASDIVDERLHVERGVCKSRISSGQYAIEALKLLSYTFLGIHCPWSWETAVRHRVDNARILLKGLVHEKGWTVGDCDNPGKHEEIARTCFVSRKRFWFTEALKMAWAPPRAVLGICYLVISLLFALLSDLSSMISRPRRTT